MPRVLLRLAADAALVAGLLCASAGTLAWRRGWILVAVLLVVRGIGSYAAYRANPELLRERARLPIHRDQPRVDRVLVLGILATGFLGLPVLAGLEATRWPRLPLPAPWLSAAGLAAFAAGWALKSLALRANAFAVTEVRPQRARGQVVAHAGVYGLVRHPFYAADPLIHIGLGLWLGSWAAVLGAAVPIGLMVVRLQLEERFLHRELPGYATYADRVRYRLVPGVW